MRRIEKIESYVIFQQLNKPFYFSQWQYDSRKICIVKITLDDGTFGWGEGYGPANVIKAGIDFFSPYLIGKVALEHETLWQEMYLRSMDYARSGSFMAALSAIDVALWDIKGKVLDLPVSVLLGGSKNPIIEPYATGLYFERVDDLEKKLVEEALGYKSEGFKAMKMKVGLGIKEDLKLIKAIRKAIGDEIRLMIDSNHAYSYKEAVELSRKSEHMNISWFEEPVSPEDYEGYCRLREQTSIPIAGGECEYLKYGFKRLLDQNCVDILQPDICAAGGLTEVKKIATLAQVYSKDLVPHSWGTWIAISAAAHLVANLDKNPGRMYNDLPTLELDRTENELRDQVTSHSMTFKDGLLYVSEEPGLGVSVCQEKLSIYTEENKEIYNGIKIRA